MQVAFTTFKNPDSTSTSDLMKKAQAIYSTGGASEKATEAALGRSQQQALSAGMQNLVSSGLAGTTMAGGLGSKFQEEVAVPARLAAQASRESSLANLYMQQASYQASRPQPSTITKHIPWAHKTATPGAAASAPAASQNMTYQGPKPVTPSAERPWSGLLGQTGQSDWVGPAQTTVTMADGRVFTMDNAGRLSATAAK